MAQAKQENHQVMEEGIFHQKLHHLQNQALLKNRGAVRWKIHIIPLPIGKGIFLSAFKHHVKTNQSYVLTLSQQPLITLYKMRFY